SKRDWSSDVCSSDLLELAIRDVRENADKVYRDIFAEFSYATDLNRSVQPAWKVDALEAMRKQQADVISDLEEKVAQAPESASDEIGRASCRERGVKI